MPTASRSAPRRPAAGRIFCVPSKPQEAIRKGEPNGANRLHDSSSPALLSGAGGNDLSADRSALLTDRTAHLSLSQVVGRAFDLSQFPDRLKSSRSSQFLRCRRLTKWTHRSGRLLTQEPSAALCGHVRGELLRPPGCDAWLLAESGCLRKDQKRGNRTAPLLRQGECGSA
jgi:hypothetical protein